MKYLVQLIQMKEYQRAYAIANMSKYLNNMYDNDTLFLFI